MNTQTLIPILITAVVLIAAVVVAWSAILWGRSLKLRKKFGSEYNYTLEQTGDRRAAEAALAEREKRINKLEIHALDEEKRNRYHDEWLNIQAHFVDDPAKSVEQADRLITEVMVARGFPVADFEQRAADLSVMYPDLVSNYRSAYDIAMKNQNDGASTEDLRQAIVYYRSLFEELLGNVEAKEKEAVTS